MKKYQLISQISLFLFFLGVSLLFFHRLFYPTLSIFTTPDFGQSDLWQLNIPLKYFLAQTLKTNSLPLWNPYLANGFPSLAEGQTGVFSLTNLLLFKFLPFPLAFNLGYVVIFLLTLFGTFLFCRELKISIFTSFVVALTFSASGFFVTHLTHFNLLQSASFFPLLLYLTLKIGSRKTTKTRFCWGTVFAFVLSQSIFSGFPQITFITLIACLILFFLNNFNRRGRGEHYSFLLLFFIILGFLIAAVQLLPQFEFFRVSTRENLDNEQATFFSYPFKHLITLIDPFLLGDPRQGTYPSFYEFDGSIFWENTGYFGVIALTIALLGLFLKIRHKKTLVLLLLFFLLLMAGKYSPFYLIYTIPPFSLFRVPSRFILPFVFTFIILFALSLDELWKLAGQKIIPKLILFSLLVLHFVNLGSFSFNYHPLVSWTTILSFPSTADFLTKEGETKRIFSFNDGENWNRIFTTTGWQNPLDFLPFLNNLKANLNVLYKIKSFSVYPVQKTKRYHYFESLLSLGIKEGDDQFSLDRTATTLLQTAGVDKIISLKNLTLSGIPQKPILETNPQDKKLSYKIFPLEKAKTTFFVTDYQKAATYEEILELLFNQKIDLAKTAIIEEDLSLTPTEKEEEATIKLVEQKPTELVYEVITNQAGILVVSQSYYPGWQAFVNNQPQKIIPVDLNLTGIQIEKGASLVKLTYFPKSFRNGAIISVLSFFITFLTGAVAFYLNRHK